MFTLNWIEATNDQSVIKIFTRLLMFQGITYNLNQIIGEDMVTINVDLKENNITWQYLDYLFRFVKITYGGKENAEC